MHKGKVSKLRPTQCVVGFAEVEEKIKELSELSTHDLDEYLQSHPFPCVIGPDDHLHTVDHHHLGLALTWMKHPDCYYEIVHDLSTVSVDKFHLVMIALDLIYLHGARGEPVALYKLPKHMDGLIDDPYRSLAGFVRKRGGFVKVDVPFSEFKWADFFRERIIIDGEVIDHVEIALELSVSEDAKKLPGYVG